MGLRIPPIPDDYGYGEDCLHCWEAGKTPNYVFVRIWDVTACPDKKPPPNGYTFICKQIPEQPCLFYGQISFGGGTWSCYYDAFVPWGLETRVELTVVLDGATQTASFFGRSTECALDFDTNLQQCPGDGGEGGHAHVTVFINPIIIALTSEYHFVTTPGIFYEHFDVGMDHAVYRIAHPQDKTNVLFLIDKEDMVFD